MQGVGAVYDYAHLPEPLHRPTLALLHAHPSGLGGSQVSMLRDAAVLRDAGWRLVLVHSGSASGDGLRHLVDDVFTDSALFATHPNRAMLRAMSEVTTWLRDTGVDVLHAHLWNSPLPLLRLAGRLPTIATVHVPLCPNGARYWFRDERPCDRTSGPGCITSGARLHGCATTADGTPYSVAGLALGVFYTKLAIRALGRCRQVIAPSEWQKRRLVADGLDARLVSVLPPAIPSSATVETARDDPPVVLSAGRLVRQKGFHHLIQAAARVPVRHRVVIAGDGPERDALAALAGSPAGDVRFVGPLSQKALNDAYARAAVVVVPSLWPETYGMVGPEALAAGTRVVAYDGGGVPDWARDSPDVTTVPVGDIQGLATALEAALQKSSSVTPGTSAPGQGLARVKRLLALHQDAAPGAGLR